jgi:putative transposase
LVIEIARAAVMARAKLILQSEFPYNLSARCINREWFQIPMQDVWNIFCEELAETSEKHKFLIHSFVLMSNHFHLIASTPEANIDQCMHRFMSRTSRQLTKNGNRINQTFAGRHFKCILQHPNYFLNAYKYNYRNPVTAKICQSVEEYPFSTLHAVMGKEPKPFAMAEDTTFFCDPVGTLTWLNEEPDPMRLEAVRFGLRRQYFLSKKCQRTRRYILGEHDTL